MLNMARSYIRSWSQILLQTADSAVEQSFGERHGNPLPTTGAPELYPDQVRNLRATRRSAGNRCPYADQTRLPEKWIFKFPITRASPMTYV